MANDKISIVIPVYKVEKYIDQCVQSVLKQTYQNLEIILVDDESPDKCPEICEQYAREDDRVKVIHQKNLGLSGARNTGMQYVTGDYVLFLDSDDFLALDYCERMIEAAKKENADIVVGEIISVDDDGGLLDDKTGLHFEQSKTIDNAQAMRQLVEQTEMKGYAWGKLYKYAVAEGIAYPVGKVYEDRFTLPLYFQRAQRISLCRQAITYYRMRTTSISHDVSIKKLNDLLEAEEWMIGFCKKNYPELVTTMESVYFGRYIHLWILLYDAGKKEEAKELVNRMKSVYKIYAEHSGIRRAHKISYRMIFMMPGLYRSLLRKMKVEQ